MRSKIKCFAAVVIALIVTIAFLGTRVYAEPFIIDYDKETQKFVKNEKALFDGLSSAMPGDTVTAEIIFKNSALTERELFFYINSYENLGQKETELLKKIEISVSVLSDETSNEIYSGKMSAALGNEGDPTIYSLGKLKPGKELTYKAVMKIPSDLDNSFALTSFPVGWKFFISDSGLKVKTPTAEPVGDTYMDKQDVELFCETTGADIFYTIDGSEPTSSSTKYNGSITVSKNTTIKAIACKPEYEDSDIMTEEYKIKCYPPEATPTGGLYDSPQKVSLTSQTTGAVIHYTTDGSEPTENSDKYIGEIPVEKNTVLKAIAVKPECMQSDTMTETYKIKTPSPSIEPKSGTYNKSVSVTITHPDPTSKIHYTTDGSTPTINSDIYDEPIVITEESVVKAIATSEDMEPSDPAQEQYEIILTPPTIKPESGTFSELVRVAITHEFPDVELRYTTDGSEPTENSSLYEDQLVIEETCTVTARAFRPKNKPSESVDEEYTIIPIDKSNIEPPVISPESGLYDEPIEVTITHPDPDATIRYTTDGSEPVETSAVYKNPFDVTENTTVSAKAFPPEDSKDKLPSVSVAETYKIKSTPPSIDPKGGTYTEKVEVTISHPDPDTDIYYTTDGTPPTKDSHKYSVPFPVTKNTKVTAIAVETKKEPSEPVSENYFIENAPPEITPPGGIYDEEVTVTITHPDPDVIIKYSTDGEDVDEYSFIYSKPFPVKENTTITAIAYKDDTEPSDPVQEEYRIKLPAPVISPEGGTYDDEIQVTIKSDIPDVEIRYTTDGSEPDENSTKYKEPFPVSKNTQITAKTFKDENEPSDPAVEVYKVKVKKPSITPDSGIYKEQVEVTISCDTPDAVIRYTTDGSEPTISSSIYSNPISITKDTKVIAKGFADEMEPSDSASEEYIIEEIGKTAKPTADPIGGTYSKEIDVALHCDTPDAVIHYTTDGTNPTRNSTIYSQPLHVSKKTIIKAIAVSPELKDSDTMIEEYIFKVATPEADPLGGKYYSSQDIVLSCKTPDVTIYYTKNNSLPSIDSIKYTEDIRVTKDTTLKAIAVKPGWEPSDIMSEKYKISKKDEPEAPQIIVENYYPEPPVDKTPAETLPPAEPEVVDTIPIPQEEVKTGVEGGISGSNKSIFLLIGIISMSAVALSYKKK